MDEYIITGASRGIGRALALELGRRPGTRLHLLARDLAHLEAVASQCANAQALQADLSSTRDARAAGEALLARTSPGAVLVHNAGLWPTRRTLTEEGYETAYVVNHLGPLALQAPLLEAGQLGRVLVVSAGLIKAGRFDPQRTPTGADFSRFRTYCTTKRCFAEETVKVAARNPQVDFLVVHPGVVRTDLGQGEGLLGWLLKKVKGRWEAPEVCAARLARILARPRWSEPGRAAWSFEEAPGPFPIPLPA